MRQWELRTTRKEDGAVTRVQIRLSLLFLILSAGQLPSSSSAARSQQGWPWAELVRKWPCPQRAREASLPGYTTSGHQAWRQGGEGQGSVIKRAAGGQRANSKGRGEGDRHSRHVRVKGQTSEINQRARHPFTQSTSPPLRDLEEKLLGPFPEKIWSLGFAREVTKMMARV